MKTIKLSLLVTLLFCLTTTLTFSQQAYLIHQDNVKPSMVWEYESIAKEFNDACKEHNPDTSWITVQMSDFKYLYVTPMENFAEMDKTPFKDMANAMGDKFGDLFDRFDKCYDSHGNYVVFLNESLTYMPDGISQTQEGENYRDYFYIYYKPENGKKIKEGMKAIKDMFQEKGSKSYYRIYHSGMGSMESYYIVAMSSKDEIDSAQKSKANTELLGPERFDVFKKMMAYAERMEDTDGKIRPDLAYSPKTE
jgi:hypothetical protein